MTPEGPKLSMPPKDPYDSLQQCVGFGARPGRLPVCWGGFGGWGVRGEGDDCVSCILYP